MDLGLKDKVALVAAGSRGLGRAVAEELVIESITVASEISEFSPKLYQEVLKIVGDVDVDEVPHHEFREQSVGVKGIIRTAEFTPYANIRILSGSAF